MAYEISNHSLKITLVAAADLLQYHFVKVDANGRAALCAAATDIPVGVVQNNPRAGEEAEVVVQGGSKVVADAALSIGALIGTSADGQADAKTVGTDTTEYVVGRALTATSAAGQIVTALVDCAAPHRAS
ncbi:MAG: capsid cement protein [Actinomycetota bacterium]